MFAFSSILHIFFGQATEAHQKVSCRGERGACAQARKTGHFWQRHEPTRSLSRWEFCQSQKAKESVNKIRLKGTVWPGQTGSAWECHWTGLEKDRYRFLIFYFWSWIFDQSSNFWGLHAKMNPTSYLFWSRFACVQTTIFFAEPCYKNAGETSIVLWITARA